MFFIHAIYVDDYNLSNYYPILAIVTCLIILVKDITIGEF